MRRAFLVTVLIAVAIGLDEGPRAMLGPMYHGVPWVLAGMVGGCFVIGYVIGRWAPKRWRQGLEDAFK